MINEKALQETAKKLRRLRLTDVYGRKEHPAETVKSVFERGLGGMYDPDAIVYVLRKAIGYYRTAELRIEAEQAGAVELPEYLSCAKCYRPRKRNGYILEPCKVCGDGEYDFRKDPRVN